MAWWIFKESPYLLEIHAEICVAEMAQQGMAVGVDHGRQP